MMPVGDAAALLRDFGAFLACFAMGWLGADLAVRAHAQWYGLLLGGVFVASVAGPAVLAGAAPVWLAIVGLGLGSIALLAERVRRLRRGIR